MSDRVCLITGSTGIAAATAERAVVAAAERFGRLDAAFNVAGISGRRYGDGPTHQATPGGWDATLDANARSMFLSCRAQVGQMLGQELGPDGLRGAILNMASVLAFSPSPALFATHAYAASKGAILAMTRSMAAYYAPEKIRINAITPGLTRTPGTLARAPRAGIASMDEEFAQVANTFQAIRRPEVPEDLVGVMSFLTSDDAAFMTGQTLNVDGGRVRS